MKSINRVAVFCGSSTGKNPAYIKEARLLGQSLALNDVGLVFGGGSVGLMNVIANAILAEGGRAHGVIPKHLLRMEVGHEGLTNLHITENMHERKAMMAELADAYIALPGGFGTFEELMEAITWSQIHIHDKQIVLFNVDGYYDKLLEFIDHSIASGFIRDSNGDIFQTVHSSSECLQTLGIQS